MAAGELTEPDTPAVPLADESTVTKAETPLLTAESIVAVAEDAGTEVFLNQYGTPYAWVPAAEPKPHFECLAIRSPDFLLRLLMLTEYTFTKTPTRSLLREAIDILELNAIRAGRRELANRITFSDEKIQIDRGDNGWEMLEVDSKGWRLKPQNRPKFFRVRHHQPISAPVSGGVWTDLFEFLHLEEEAERLLVLVWILAALHPEVQSPMLVVIGPQGSGKTTFCRRIRSLLDPSVVSMLGDLEVGNLFQTFHHHAIPCFENVSHFNRKTADMFCRAVTGNGVERRRLYTDADQVLYSFRRAILINGIALPSVRPDFLDRCLVIHCKRIESFESLQHLDQAFEKARPKILGSLLNLLSKALGVVGTTPTPKEFRMADFARFGRAVAAAVGTSVEEFDVAYRENVRQQTEDLVEDCPVARLVREFAQSHPAGDPWTGNATELLKRLLHLATRMELFGAKKDLPKSPRWLSTRLTELAPALQAEGIVVQKGPRTNKTRTWEISLASRASTYNLQEIRNRYEAGETHEQAS